MRLAQIVLLQFDGHPCATTVHFESTLSFRVIWWAANQSTIQRKQFTFDVSVCCAIVIYAKLLRHSDFNHISPHTHTHTHAIQDSAGTSTNPPFIYDSENLYFVPCMQRARTKIRTTTETSRINFPLVIFLLQDLLVAIVRTNYRRYIPAIEIVAIFQCFFRTVVVYQYADSHMWQEPLLGFFRIFDLILYMRWTW